MPKIRLTKNELKVQRENLKRFSRFLPTLQLKKQQLTLEVRRVRESLAELQRDEDDYRHGVEGWLALLGGSSVDAAFARVEVTAWHTGIRNIAGTDIPTFIGIEFAEVAQDLFVTPPWADDLVLAVRHLVELGLRRRIVNEQIACLEQELRVTTQRVNLFEKVKIPEASQHIRTIQIYLGDQQTGAVGRAKIAKGKCEERELALTGGPA